MRQGRARAVALAAAGAVGLSVWATWPLAAHLSTHVYDPSGHRGFVADSLRADVRLVLWILAWDVHALVTAPLALFDANVFHPAPLSLALSEHLLGALPIYAPLALASGDPVFAHQATVLLTFVGAFGAAFALVWVWTRDVAAAWLAGSLFAFSPFRAGHLGGVQILGGWYLPLVVLAAWRSATSRSRWAPVALAATVAVVGLHSMYLAYAVVVGMAVLIAVLVVADARTRRRWRRLLLPILAAGVAIAASAVPYLAVRGGGALAPPPRGFVEFGSTGLGQTGATLALVLAGVTAPWWRRGLRSGVAAVWLVALGAAALATHVLALGPTIRVAGVDWPGPYRLVAALVPGFASLRIPLRFDAFTTAAVATLAGVGVAGVLAAIATPGARRLARVAVLAAAVAVARLGMPQPVPLEPIETRTSLPPIYGVLADAGAGPVVELPWHDFERTPRERGADAVRVYRSVYHWRPLLNGYSGYAPRTYPLVGALVEALPAPEAVRLLARTTGLRHVLVHDDEIAPDERTRWATASEASLRVVARAGSDVLFALRDPPAPDLLPQLRSGAPAPATLTGTPLVALGSDGRHAVIRGAFEDPSQLGRGRPLRLVLDVTNTSRERWPALAIDAPHRVVLAGRWDPVGGGASHPQSPVGRIPWDLAPGESARVVAVVRVPAVPGLWRLAIGAAQDGVWFDDPLSIDVRVQ